MLTKRQKWISEVNSAILSKKLTHQLNELEADFAEKLFNIDWDKSDPEDKVDIFSKYEEIFELHLEGFEQEYSAETSKDLLKSEFRANNCDIFEVGEFWGKFWDKVSFIFTGYPVRPYGV